MEYGQNKVHYYYSVKQYIIDYYEHFGLHPEADIVWDEYIYVKTGDLVQALNIHHIDHGASKHDDITNLMALSYDNHTLAHAEKLLPRDQLKEVHLQFLKNNPYD